MLLGITGTDGSGKGTVVDHLVNDKGFAHYSARAIWVEEIGRQGIENNRANMRNVANQLRKKHGNDFLVAYYLQKMATEQPKDAIIESIRALAEAKTLKANGGILIAVDANQQLRYDRIQERQSASDEVTFTEFMEHERLEMNDPDPNGMQKAAVMEAADYTIMNNGSLEELHTAIEAVLEQITQAR